MLAHDAGTRLPSRGPTRPHRRAAVLSASFAHVLTQPFRRSGVAHGWALVLYYRRLLLLLVGVFVVDGVTRAFMLTAVLLAALTANLVVQPMRSAVVNRLETALLLCAATLSMSNSTGALVLRVDSAAARLMLIAKPVALVAALLIICGTFIKLERSKK